MVLKNIALVLVSYLVLSCNNAIADIPYGNGVWTYDTTFLDGKKQPPLAGLFSEALLDFNKNAAASHRITQIFSPGSDIKLYCRGSGQSAQDTPCTGQQIIVPYYPQDGVNTPRDSGFHSTTAYANAFQSQPDVLIVPLIDGRLDNTGADDYLSALNRLSKEEAYELADKLALTYCADDRVAGVQFDIEPFDITKPGQQYFYARLAQDFAGQSYIQEDGSDALHCVNNKHPQGRFFSVFAFAKDVVSPLGDIFTKYHNAMVVDSLYDLGTKPGGNANSLEEYQVLVKKEVADMLAASARQNQVNFQFAIPASASATEFETVNGIPSGYKQIEYVSRALDAIDDSGARSHPQFKGINLWTWMQLILWRGNAYTPAQPSEEVQSLLQQRL